MSIEGQRNGKGTVRYTYINIWTEHKRNAKRPVLQPLLPQNSFLLELLTGLIDIVHRDANVPRFLRLSVSVMV